MRDKLDGLSAAEQADKEERLTISIKEILDNSKYSVKDKLSTILRLVSEVEGGSKSAPVNMDSATVYSFSLRLDECGEVEFRVLKNREGYQLVPFGPGAGVASRILESIERRQEKHK